MVQSTSTGKKSPIDVIRRKSLDALDYPDVQAAVVANTTFPLAEELARGIEPVYTAREVEELQRETRDGVAYLEESGDPDLSARVDATEAVDRASLAAC